MDLVDVQIDVFRKTKSVNETPRAVRVTHKPSGIKVVKDEGTQTENKMLALIELAGKVAENLILDKLLRMLGNEGNCSERCAEDFIEKIEKLSGEDFVKETK